jgi:hypothetical protein
MNKAFPWLVAFTVIQALLIASTRLPNTSWRSFRAANPRDIQAAGFATTLRAESGDWTSGGE